MDSLYTIFNKVRLLLPLTSRPKPGVDTSSQQPPTFDEIIRQRPAHKEIFGADGSPIFGKIVGSGSSGWVFRISEDKVLKVPRLITDFADKDLATQTSYKHRNNSALKSFEKEKEVYRRLGQFKDIISARPTDAGIEFPYIRGGTAWKYLTTHDNVDFDLRFRWVKTITDVVRRVHREHILINDFNLENFLLNDDLSLVMIDLGQARIIPNDIKFGDYVDRALSEKGDIAAIGSLIYEIMTGRGYEVRVNLLAPFDVTESDETYHGVAMWFPYWPPKEELADTTDVPLGDIILQCWLKDGFQTMEEVCGAVAAMER